MQKVKVCATSQQGGVSVQTVICLLACLCFQLCNEEYTAMCNQTQAYWNNESDIVILASDLVVIYSYLSELNLFCMMLCIFASLAGSLCETKILHV